MARQYFEAIEWHHSTRCLPCEPMAAKPHKVNGLVPVCCSLMLLPVATHGIVLVSSPTEMLDAHFVLPTYTSIPCKRSGQQSARFESWTDVTSHMPLRDTIHHAPASLLVLVHVPGQVRCGDPVRAFFALSTDNEELCNAVITLYGMTDSDDSLISAQTQRGSTTASY